MPGVAAWGDKRLGHAVGRGRTEREEFGTPLDLLGDIAPINDLVSDCAEERFGRFGQEHELLDAVDLSIAFEPGDELVPQSTLPITGCDSQRTQQGVRAEALHTDDSEERFFGLEYPPMQTRGACQVIRRESGTLEERQHGRKVDA